MDSENKRNFDEAALEWDSFAPRVKLTTDIGDSLLKRVELRSDMDVLDFGCGTGLLSLRMAESVKSLTGADTSGGMLEVMAGKAEELGLFNVSTFLVDPEGDAAFSGTYDLIVSSMVFHHLEDVQPVLKRMAAALKPGGKIGLADLDPDGGTFHSNPAGVMHDGFDRDTFAEELVAAGFSTIEVSTAAAITKPVEDDVHEFTIFLAVGIV